MADAKAFWRDRLRAARRELTPSGRRAAHAAMAARLVRFADEVDASSVAIYAALATEADPAPAAQRWIGERIVVAYPRVVGDALDFHLLDSPAELIAGGFRGIREPAPEAPRLPIADIELLVVPGVGFDRFGRRVGQGGGFYDRLLAHPELRALTVGLAYSAQVLPRVPVDEHDVALDAVVTEVGLARGGRWTR